MILKDPVLLCKKLPRRTLAIVRYFSIFSPNCEKLSVTIAESEFMKNRSLFHNYRS